MNHSHNILRSPSGEHDGSKWVCGHCLPLDRPGLAPCADELRCPLQVNVQFASALSRWLVQPRVSEPGHEPHERLCTLVQTGVRTASFAV